MEPVRDDRERSGTAFVIAAGLAFVLLVAFFLLIVPLAVGDGGDAVDPAAVATAGGAPPPVQDGGAPGPSAGGLVALGLTVAAVAVGVLLAWRAMARGRAATRPAPPPDAASPP